MIEQDSLLETIHALRRIGLSSSLTSVLLYGYRVLLMDGLSHAALDLMDECLRYDGLRRTSKESMDIQIYEVLLELSYCMFLKVLQEDLVTKFGKFSDGE
jgi:hypothetical protein